MGIVRKMLLCTATATAVVSIAACGGGSPATGDAAAISDAVQSLADTVTAPGAMTPTEFVAAFCKQHASEPDTTQQKIAKELALAVAANDSKGSGDTDATKQEAANETPNALALIANVSACQAYPLS